MCIGSPRWRSCGPICAVIHRSRLTIFSAHSLLRSRTRTVYLKSDAKARRSFLFFVLLAKCKRHSICVSKLTKIFEASKAEIISTDCVREVDIQCDLSFLFLGSP